MGDVKTRAAMTDEEALLWVKERFKREQTILCERLRVEASAAGVSRLQLKAARKRLGVKTWHQFDEGGATENWFWTTAR